MCFNKHQTHINAIYVLFTSILEVWANHNLFDPLIYCSKVIGLTNQGEREPS